MLGLLVNKGQGRAVWNDLLGLAIVAGILIFAEQAFAQENPLSVIEDISEQSYGFIVAIGGSVAAVVGVGGSILMYFNILPKQYFNHLIVVTAIFAVIGPLVKFIIDQVAT